MKIEKDARYGTRQRVRYVGQGSRGAPNRAQLAHEQERNVRFAAQEADKALVALRLATSPEAEAMPPFQRQALYQDVLAPLGLAGRLLEEVEDFVKRRIKQRRP